MSTRFKVILLILLCPIWVPCAMVYLIIKNIIDEVFADIEKHW